MLNIGTYETFLGTLFGWGETEFFYKKDILKLVETTLKHEAKDRNQSISEGRGWQSRRYIRTVPDWTQIEVKYLGDYQLNKEATQLLETFVTEFSSDNPLSLEVSGYVLAFDTSLGTMIVSAEKPYFGCYLCTDYANSFLKKSSVNPLQDMDEIGKNIEGKDFIFRNPRYEERKQLKFRRKETAIFFGVPSNPAFYCKTFDTKSHLPSNVPFITADEFVRYMAGTFMGDETFIEYEYLGITPFSAGSIHKYIVDGYIGENGLNKELFTYFAVIQIDGCRYIHIPLRYSKVAFEYPYLVETPRKIQGKTVLIKNHNYS